MKAFYVLFLLVFLASCGSVDTQTTQEVETSDTPEVSIVSEDDAKTEEMEEDEMSTDEDDMQAEMSEDIDADTASLDEEATNEVMTIDATYNNPKTEVDMKINYSLDENGIIESMQVTATTYDVTGFNAAAQELVGQDISAAEDFYVAGGSLTSSAFTTAIKNR